MATLSIRLDDSTHSAFLKFCDVVGLSASAAFNLFAKTVVREQRIPFEIKTDAFNSEENMSHLRAAAKRMEEQKYVIREYKMSVAEPEGFTTKGGK